MVQDSVSTPDTTPTLPLLQGEGLHPILLLLLLPASPPLGSASGAGELSFTASPLNLAQLFFL